MSVLLCPIDSIRLSSRKGMRVSTMSKTSAFDDAWSVLKGDPYNQMYGQTMHPAIAAMLARRGMNPHDAALDDDGKLLYDETGYPVAAHVPPFLIPDPPGEGRRDDVDPDGPPYLRVPERGVSDLAQMERGSVFDTSRHVQGEGGLFHLPLDQNPDYLAYLARGGRPVSQAYIEQRFKDKVEGF